MEVTSEIRKEVLKLMQEKEKLEDEIKELTSILTRNGVGMTDPLVDAEGFPLNSVDIYQVRHARHRIICLQNDHKAIMKEIENGLQGYYSSSTNLQSSEAQLTHNFENHVLTHRMPFAKVTLVSPGSPAEYSGLQANDLLVEFGSVNSTNFKAITDILAVVQHSEGQQLPVKLQREEHYVITQLIPKKWTGKGLLGCSVVSLST